MLNIRYIILSGNCR